MKKWLSLLLAVVLAASLLAACGGGTDSGVKVAGADGSSLPAYNTLKVGEDYTDLTAELRAVMSSA